MKSVASLFTLRAAATAITAALLSAGAVSNVTASEALQVESSALRSAQLNRQVMRDYGGHYRLEDGSVLRFSREGARVFASISGEASERRVEVKAVSANRLVALNEATEFRFVNNGKDSVTISQSAGDKLSSKLAIAPGVQATQPSPT